MREKLIAEVLRLLEETGDPSMINLRLVAKRAGCAHTNVYNYFKNTEDMIWQAALPAFARIREATTVKLKAMNLPELGQRIAVFCDAYMSFALDHPGLFRFFWLYETPEPSLRPADLADALGRYWLELLEAIFGKDSGLSTQGLENTGSTLLGYLHGETCHLVNGRYFGNLDALKQTVIGRGVGLVEALLRVENGGY